MAKSDIADARQAFDSLLGEAASTLIAKRYEEAARIVQNAANAAFLRHPGILFSREAESLLREISEACLPAIPRRNVRSPERRPHVLHVLTLAYSIGGHTRLVRRWIENDSGSCHSVVLTQQLSVPVPEWLAKSVASSNGQMWSLDERDDLIEKARSLRELGQDFDTIVLHIHPFDAVPLIAWAGSMTHPPVIHLNHADHLFWLGVSISDVNANIRQSGYRTSIRRRGLAQDANVVLPIPLVEADQPLPSRKEARAQLELAEDCPVALTVASAHKFSAVGEMDYVKLHLPLLERCPKLQIIVVGPSLEKNYWEECFRLTEGRIRAVGVQLELGSHFAAADVYVDSTPFGSLTSLLEAGLAGVPCCSWRPHTPTSSASVLACDDIAFDGLKNAVAYDDREKYWEQLSTYLNDTTAATLASQELRANIIRYHTGKGWRTSLNEAYARALILAGTRTQDRPAVVQAETSAVDEILLAMQDGFVDNPPDPSPPATALKKRGLVSRIRRSLKKRLSRFERLA